jgi:hydroxypyruvate isomerase
MRASTICVELLNSKVDHKGYQGDRTPFGVEVVKAVNSPRVKLLYDAYHMQIMEGEPDPHDPHQQGLHRARPHTAECPAATSSTRRKEVNWRARRHRARRPEFRGLHGARVRPNAQIR